MNSLGARLRQTRASRGMTQAELAKGVATKGFISLVERDLANCSLPKLRLLADRLGRPLSYFLPEAPIEDAELLSKTAELALRAGEPRRALKEVEQALRLGITANARANLLRIRGIALFELGRWERAARELQSAAALAPPDDPELTGQIYTELGHVLGSAERYTASIEANMRALKAFEACRHPNPDQQARALTNLANDSYHLGQLGEAIGYLKRALAISTDAENLTRMANAHMALGITARASGDYDSAIRHCDRALAMHRLLHHERVTNHILNNLGDVHFAAGRVDEARANQQACLERGRQTNDAIAVTAAATELARYALSEGRLDEALALARDGQAAALRARDHLYEAIALSIQAWVSERKRNRTDADAQFGKALRLLQARGATAKLAELCASYSELLEGRGDRQRALAFMRMAYARDFTKLLGLLRAQESRKN
jgi:HTH-type transcriptional regulator, quorum sensing regulator NprR